MTFGPLHTKKLVEFLSTRPTLQLVSYKRISKIIGEPYPSGTAARSFYAARDVLLNDHNKLVLTVRGKGYFVADKNAASKYATSLKSHIRKVQTKKNIVTKIAA